MNEELKQRLIKYLDGMEGAIDKVVDFTVEQAPLVIPLTLCSFFTAQNGLKAYVAPRLYILEQIKDFVNDSK